MNKNKIIDNFKDNFPPILWFNMIDKLNNKLYILYCILLYLKA